MPEPIAPDSEDIRDLDLIVIGAGSGNSVVGEQFDGWSVALIDDGEWFGGTCLNAGCIPTKMFVRVADVSAEAQDADRIGLSATIDPIDWPAIRDRVFAKTDKISWAGFRYRDERSPNVTVYRETVRFEGKHAVRTASGTLLRSPRIVVAAGSRPRELPIAHEPDDAIGNSDHVMRIESLPESLVIVGGGAVAVEFAHIFGALGVEVTLVARSACLLTHEDRDVALRFTELARERWRVHTEDTVESVERVEDHLAIRLSSGAELEAERMLVALGRVPNTDRLHAEEAGFDLHDDGRLVVDGHQRVLANGRPVEGVFALGDVSSPWQLKHVANHEARIVEHNLEHPDALVGGYPGPVASAIFSSPQIAHVGLTEEQAVAAGTDVISVIQEYRTTAYGWALEDTTSFCKLLVDRTSGILLGAHIIGPEASILIQPLISIASGEHSIRGVARAQFWPHPAATEVVENALLAAEKALEDAT